MSAHIRRFHHKEWNRALIEVSNDGQAERFQARIDDPFIMELSPMDGPQPLVRLLRARDKCWKPTDTDIAPGTCCDLTSARVLTAFRIC
jgi:polyphosphate kinase 2 (PPK2 family)